MSEGVIDAESDDDDKDSLKLTSGWGGETGQD